MKSEVESLIMECHYCSNSADVAIEKGPVKVALCKTHLRGQFRELAKSDRYSELKGRVDEQHSKLRAID